MTATQHWLGPTFTLAALEKLVNTALRYDPASLQRIAAMDGKILSFNLSQPSLQFYLLAHHEGFTFLSEYEGESDAEISAPARELLKKLSPSSKEDPMIGGKTKVQGNNQLVQELQAIFQDLDIDWEEPLSHYVGDIAAHEIGRHSRRAGRWLARAGKTLLQDSEEYLHYEAKITVPDFYVDDFITDVDQLRLDVDRLEARIARLEKNRASKK